MVTQILFFVVVLSLVVFVSFSVSFFLKIRKEIQVIRNDFHLLTEKACSLMVKLEDLSDEVKQKSQTLNSIPGLLNSVAKLSFFSKEKGKRPFMPALMDVLVKSFVLVKRTRDLVKNK